MDRAAIFDMDGLLVDSEPLWQAAEKRVFARVGIDLSDAMCQQTVGMRIDEVVRHWHARYPWDEKRLETVEAEVIHEVSAEILTHGTAKPGVMEVLEFFSRHGWKIGLASSSPLPLIETVVQHLGIAAYFSTLCSAFDEARGKPHPAVYLTAARRLGVNPVHCLAFEDSAAGVASARGAQMAVVFVPETPTQDSRGAPEADLRLASLEEFSAAHLEHLFARGSQVRI